MNQVVTIGFAVDARVYDGLTLLARKASCTQSQMAKLLFEAAYSARMQDVGDPALEQAARRAAVAAPAPAPPPPPVAAPPPPPVSVAPPPPVSVAPPAAAGALTTSQQRSIRALYHMGAKPFDIATQLKIPLGLVRDFLASGRRASL